METRRVNPPPGPLSLQVNKSTPKRLQYERVHVASSRAPASCRLPPSPKMPYPSVETHHVSEPLELDGVAGCKGCHGLGNLADKVGHLVAEAPERQANTSSGEV